MKALRVLVAACACATLLAAAPPHTTIYGFTPLASDREFNLEDRFLDIPTAAGALETAAMLAARPRYAGSDGDYKLAYYVRDKFKEFGLDAAVETLTARIDTPKKLALELVPTGTRPAKATVPASTPIFGRSRKRREAEAGSPFANTAPADGFDLRELPDPSDPETANPAVGLPLLAGSVDGDVSGPLVYAGHGMPSDYQLFAAHGIDPSGAVLLIRFDAEPRGDVVRCAQTHGVHAVVMYDDPADDGPGRGGAYPNGPWRPLNPVQRGSLGITVPGLPISANNARLPDQAQPGTTLYDRDAFLFSAGTPSANATFSGPFGRYHSSYDTLQYARAISDPEFALHRAAAQIYGIAALRLANADVVPYHFSAYVVRALHDGDRAALDLAVARARTTIEHASNLIR